MNRRNTLRWLCAAAPAPFAASAQRAATVPVLAYVFGPGLASE